MKTNLAILLFAATAALAFTGRFRISSLNSRRSSIARYSRKALC